MDNEPAKDDEPRLLHIFAPEDDGGDLRHRPGQVHFACPHCRRPLLVIVEDVQLALLPGQPDEPSAA